VELVPAGTLEGTRKGAWAQESKIKVNAIPSRLSDNRIMIYIVLEAFLAGMILVLIVWWTMFAGRHKGELVEPSGETQDTGPQTKA
jgi:hypothetical protein